MTTTPTTAGIDADTMAAISAITDAYEALGAEVVKDFDGPGMVAAYKECDTANKSLKAAISAAIQAARDEERERCAKIAEEWAQCLLPEESRDVTRHYFRCIAAAFREVK